jgi:uncharacterized protein
MDYAAMVLIGLVMGLFGGLLGIGGSVVMIPAMAMVFGENQHLYQAAAMMCNFFVSISALISHRKEKVLVASVLKWMIPLGIVGILIGVAISNTSIFAGDKSYLLGRAFGAFLVYVIVYNTLKLVRPKRAIKAKTGERSFSKTVSMIIGGVTGVGAGLLGMGAGTVSTPLQQIWLKMPMKKAMSNSSAMITSVALIGALYKNLTLGKHGLYMIDSLKIAAVIIPTAIIGGFFGGKLMHALPKNVVRAVFVGVLILSAIKMLTLKPAG